MADEEKIDLVGGATARLSNVNMLRSMLINYETNMPGGAQQ